MKGECAEPAMDVQYPLHIGQSVRHEHQQQRGRPRRTTPREMLSLRFNHMPGDTDLQSSGRLQVEKENNMTVVELGTKTTTSHSNTNSKIQKQRFSGKASNNRSDYVLVFVNGKFWLERVDQRILRHDGVKDAMIDIDEKVDNDADVEDNVNTNSTTKDPDSWDLDNNESSSPVTPEEEDNGADDDNNRSHAHGHNDITATNNCTTNINTINSTTLTSSMNGNLHLNRNRKPYQQPQTNVMLPYVETKSRTGINNANVSSSSRLANRKTVGGKALTMPGSKSKQVSTTTTSSAAADNSDDDDDDDDDDDEDKNSSSMKYVNRTGTGGGMKGLSQKTVPLRTPTAFSNHNLMSNQRGSDDEDDDDDDDDASSKSSSDSTDSDDSDSSSGSSNSSGSSDSSDYD